MNSADKDTRPTLLIRKNPPSVNRRFLLEYWLNACTVHPVKITVMALGFDLMHKLIQNSNIPNMRTRVKICGLTRSEDAQAAAGLGVDAIGLVFYPPSPRNVNIAQAKRIVAALPPFVTVVGLFVDEQPQRVVEILNTVRIDLLQFHGEESPDYCKAFDRAYIRRSA